MEVKHDQDFEIFQVAEITAEEAIKKEESSDYETFKIVPVEIVPVKIVPVEIIPREEKREVMPIEEIDPEKCIFTEESEFKWVKQKGKWRKRKNVEGKSGRPKKVIPFSCCHCEFIGNNRNQLLAHKRDMESCI